MPLYPGEYATIGHDMGPHKHCALKHSLWFHHVVFQQEINIQWAWCSSMCHVEVLIIDHAPQPGGWGIQETR